MVKTRITSAFESDSPPRCSFVLNSTSLTTLRPAAQRGRYVPMKPILQILFAVLISASVSAADFPKYVITSDCISSVEVMASKYVPGWDLVIKLKDIEAKNLYEFSKENIDERVFLIDGNDNNIIRNGAVIREPLPSPFHVSGIETQEEAIDARKTILSSVGDCGVKKH